jgi:hypothetical protein
MSTEPTPTLPADYVVPAVWTFEEQEGKMGGMNRPTAGARSEAVLQRGDHELQLYSLGTPNGIKVTILLEELNDLKGVEYDAWKIDIFKLDQFGSEFVAANPNSKIPVMLDHALTPPLRIFESANILKHVRPNEAGLFLHPTFTIVGRREARRVHPDRPARPHGMLQLALLAPGHGAVLGRRVWALLQLRACEDQVRHRPIYDGDQKNFRRFR